jgi:hypothetical protein
LHFSTPNEGRKTTAAALGVYSVCSTGTILQYSSIIAKDRGVKTTNKIK